MRLQTSHPRLLQQVTGGKILRVDFEQRHFSRSGPSQVLGWCQRCPCGSPYTRGYRSAADKSGKPDQCVRCFVEGLR